MGVRWGISQSTSLLPPSTELFCRALWQMLSDRALAGLLRPKRGRPTPVRHSPPPFPLPHPLPQHTPAPPLPAHSLPAEGRGGGSDDDPNSVRLRAGGAEGTHEYMDRTFPSMVPSARLKTVSRHRLSFCPCQPHAPHPPHTPYTPYTPHTPHRRWTRDEPTHEIRRRTCRVEKHTS